MEKYILFNSIYIKFKEQAKLIYTVRSQDSDSPELGAWLVPGACGILGMFCLLIYVLDAQCTSDGRIQ